jgi:hypothetical protein
LEDRTADEQGMPAARPAKTNKASTVGVSRRTGLVGWLASFVGSSRGAREIVRDEG